ncbi:MAG: substrate-binding domain-containing protein [Anaerolineae bacterium]|nr:substrate-binding domain-containing protein [Anaerolineae bacterium]
MDARTGNSRPTIGLLIQAVTDTGGYHAALWRGIVEAARQRDVNLICFAGGELPSSPGDRIAVNMSAVYRLISKHAVDALIISGSICTGRPSALRPLYELYRHLPLVSITPSLEEIPTVTVDNYSSMRRLMAHLTQHHGYRRIAFICGPEGHPEAIERYQAYVDVLGEYGIPVDPRLVAPGDYQTPAGRAAIRLLLDERGVDFEALVAANDGMALGAINELQQRGIRVPYDVAVTGFDDVAAAGASTPSLTTIRQPMFELGKRAIEMLSNILVGEPQHGPVTIPASLMVRESCGCIQPARVTTAAAQLPVTNEPLETTLTAQRENIIFAMAHAVGSTSPVVTARAERLLDAFIAEITGEAQDSFLPALDDVLRQEAMEGRVSSWQEAISTLRSALLPYLTDKGRLRLAEELWHQSRVMTGERARRTEISRALEAELLTINLHNIGQSIISVFDINSISEIVTRDFPRLGIPACYIALYEGPGAPAEQSKLIAAYDEHTPIPDDPEARSFPSPQLVPGGFSSHRERFTMIVEPLASRENSLGFVVFETGPLQGEVYSALRGHLSSAIQGALLVQAVAERTRSLQEANYALQRRALYLETSAEVTQAITSIFDLDQLFRKAVSLIRDRFGFYHAGIFLIDESGEWAVLREATGEAGAQMKAMGHRLAVAETSMVGWTALHRKPRIALYAEEDAVRYANPLLPYTRSEMTLPMIVGGRLLGVLNVQSTEEAAFDDDDVRALQTMANQVAVAIENARRIADETRLLEAASPIYRLSRNLARATTVSEVAESIISSIAETGADGCTVVEFEFSPEGEPTALLYRGVWRKDREVQFKPGMRLSMAESPFPLELVSRLWVVTDVENDEMLPESARRVFTETGVMALVNIPLQGRDRVIGQVVVLRDTPGPFSEADLRLYEAISDQAAVAMERAYLLEEAQRRAEYEHLVRQATDHIRRAVNVERALQTAAQELANIMKVPQVSIELGIRDGDLR